MRIKVVYGELEFLSKEIEVNQESVEEFAENLQQNVNKMTEMKLECEYGWVIMPKFVLERSVIIVLK